MGQLSGLQSLPAVLNPNRHPETYGLSLPKSPPPRSFLKYQNLPPPPQLDVPSLQQRVWLLSPSSLR